MISLQEFCETLDDYLKPSTFKDYCPNGLQVEGNPKIQKFCTAVSADLETIQQAAENQCQLLICHHGLFWNHPPHTITGPKKEKLRLLLKSNMNLIAYHLPLDAHMQVGNNWKAARDLGWKNLEPFGFYEGQYIGVKGNFKAMPLEAFQKKLEAYYGHSATTAFGGQKTVSSAGLVSGGAYKLIPEAAKAKLDCFISGSFDEPAWSMAAEERVNFFALGHTATEKVGPKALGEWIAKKLKLDWRFIDTKNPF